MAQVTAQPQPPRPAQLGDPLQASRDAMLPLVAALLALAIGPVLVATHSTRAPPLRRLHQPEGATLRILRRDAEHVTRRALARRADSYNATALRAPQPSHEGSHADVRHDDTILVRFVVDRRPISLVLSPTPDLVHPDARVHYHTLLDSITGATIVTTEPIRREDVRAYSGHVVREAFIERWWAEAMAGLVRTGSADDDDSGRTAGWARLSLRPQDGAWDGVFAVDGRVHHVKPIDSYMRTRLDADPLPGAQHYLRPSVQPGAQTVIFSDGDLVDEHALDVAPTSCHHDDLGFNTDALATGLRVDASATPDQLSSLGWVDSIIHDTRGALVRRQTGGDVAGGGNQSRTFSDSIGNTVGCPKERRVVFMGVAAECVCRT